MVRDWFNPRDRGLATGIFNCASSLGTAIAVPLLTFLMLYFGWRDDVHDHGHRGSRHGGDLVSRLSQPDRSRARRRRKTSTGRKATRRAQRTKVTLREWQLLFRFRTTWGMILGYFGCIYLTWIFTAWLPGYLEIQRHMSVKFTGLAAAVPFAWGVVGGVTGGYVVDFLVRRGVRPFESRSIRPRLPCPGQRPARSPRPSSPATRWRSPSFPRRCSSSISPAPAPGR